MRKGAILLVMFALAGCANFREVVNSAPDATGTIVVTKVFGGNVSVVPDPTEYVMQDVNREGRIVYGDARRNTKAAISTAITKLFESTK